jgi:UDP-N-acetylmuramate dehydrogenase
MLIQENISLSSLNSFGCKANASHFCIVKRKDELNDAISWCKHQQKPFLILGGGSNILFTKDFDGLVIKMEIKGIELVRETPSDIIINVGAGENWHLFVKYCVQKSWGGIENLSLIPGTVGAAPIQNIGAYGVEAKDSITQITAFDTQLNQWTTILNKECKFGYRTSLFKQEKNRYIITEVQFCLQKQPKLHTDYGAIRDVLHRKQIKQPSIESISDAVIEIRSEKLPNPSTLGNAGSFFKNPTVSIEVYNALKEAYPTLVAFPISNTEYKLAAGWLIEQAGWKGKRNGAVGCYDKQALVIVNYEDATGSEIYNFSEEIIQSVQVKFGIQLEREVNVV